MPFLSWAQRRTGKALGSNAVVADSTQTLLCTYLSAVLLLGLVLNATLGWHWADPLAGLVIAAIAVQEGREAWRGEGCCGPVGAAHLHEEASGGCDSGGGRSEQRGRRSSRSRISSTTTGTCRTVPEARDSRRHGATARRGARRWRPASPSRWSPPS